MTIPNARLFASPPADGLAFPAFPALADRVDTIKSFVDVGVEGGLVHR